MNILIADDEELIRYDVRAILEDLDGSLTISEAVNGRELFEMVRQEKPDAAFVDIRMPGFSGLEAIGKLCKLKLATKYIILSGHAEFEYARKALQYGVMEYLLKPVNSSELEQVLLALKRNLRLQQPELPPLSVDDRDLLSKSAVIVRQAEQLVREHFQEAVGVAQIAEMLNITPNYLSSQFKREKGSSLTSLITDLRLEKSKEILRQPGSTVKTTCLQLGYLSPRHFANLFKEKYGIAPSDYIRLNPDQL